MNNKVKYQLISNHSTKDVLYAFISNGVVKYIGKTTMQLKKRMDGYQEPHSTQTTNCRVNQKIKEILSSDQPVDIFILVDNNLLKYGDFKIKLAAGLEDTLIYEISPEWNYSGKNKIEEDKNSEKEELIEKKSQIDLTTPVVGSFEITLGQAYYNQGFFNVTKDFSDKFGADKTVVEIQLGNNQESIIQGYINRTANRNGTPRIMGGKKLTEWIQDNFRKDDIMSIDILTPVSIKLNQKKMIA